MEQALDLGAIVDLAGGAVFKEFCEDDLVNLGGGSMVIGIVLVIAVSSRGLLMADGGLSLLINPGFTADVLVIIFWSCVDNGERQFKLRPWKIPQ